MGKPIDLVGQNFGRWTVLQLDSTRTESGHRQYFCKCNCGTERLVSSNALRMGKSNSCGCLTIEVNSNRINNLKGQRFGRLIALEEAYRKKGSGVYWKCLCDCGKENIVVAANLSNGHTTSCGCMRNEKIVEEARKKLSTNPRIRSAKAVFSHSYNDGDLSFEKFLELSQQPCFYCGLSSQKSNIKNSYKKGGNTLLPNIEDGDFYYNGLDRIDSNKVHDLDNVVPCCKWCNYAKMHRTLEEFITWIKRVSAHLIQKETDSSKLESVSELSVI
ncbi:MAG: hypothetical protein AB7I18_11890 [Candidatus Berkiella sp.]